MTQPWTAWWWLARPAGLWLPPTLPLIGYGWAHWDRALLAWRLEALPAVLVAWVLLQAGTLWLNAARDQDAGEVLLGRAVPVPPGTTTLALATLILSVLVCTLGGAAPAVCCGICALLSILYSWPGIAWKGHPVLGPAVNVVGYGLLSPAAGYAVVGTPLTLRTGLTVALIALAVLGATFIAQAFQEQEDRERGDRTLVATHGSAAVLWVGRACLAGVATGIGALVAAGWYPWPVLAGLPAMWWMDRILAGWLARGGSEATARRLVWAGVAALLGVLMGAGTAYVGDALADRPVAGLATPAGHPRDRSPRAASTQQALDYQHRQTVGTPYRPH